MKFKKLKMLGLTLGLGAMLAACGSDDAATTNIEESKADTG